MVIRKGHQCRLYVIRRNLLLIKESFVEINILILKKRLAMEGKCDKLKSIILPFVVSSRTEK